MGVFGYTLVIYPIFRRRMINSKSLILIIILSFLFCQRSYLEAKSNIPIEKIENAQNEYYKKQFGTNEPNHYSLLRNKVLNYLNDDEAFYMPDTFILFYGHDIQSARDFGSVWSRSQTYNFICDSDTFDIKKDGYCNYSDFLIENILLKNFDKIKKVEEKKGALLDGSYVNVILIINNEKDFEIRCFGFNEFFTSLRLLE